jgi:hypothetical protein
MSLTEIVDNEIIHLWTSFEQDRSKIKRFIVILVVAIRNNGSVIFQKKSNCDKVTRKEKIWDLLM